jgi:hypothetical protein
LKPAATTRGELHTGYRLAKPHIDWMLFENDFANDLGAWSLLGANGQPRSMAIGNTLMLLMKPPTAQGGETLVFHMPDRPANPLLPEDDSPEVLPEVPPRQRRYTRSETRTCQRENRRS